MLNVAYRHDVYQNQLTKCIDTDFDSIQKSVRKQTCMMKVGSDIVTIVLSVLTVIVVICVLPVPCRQAIKPIDDIIVRDKTKKPTEYESETFSAINADPCRLNVQRDLPKPNDPQPLYIIPDTNEIWNPNKNGFIEIPAGRAIELYCSSNFGNGTLELDRFKTIPKNIKSLKPICIGGTTFNWRGEKYQFNQFICAKPSKFTVERLIVNNGCDAKSSELYRVGYNVTKNRFIESMQICYDNNIWRNHYTKHRIFPGSVHLQRYVERLNFSKAGFFEDRNVNFYYTQRNQKARALELFGSNATIKTYFNGGDMFLARGHLAAKADFVYANQQRATFIFLNVAPQWQSFNAGQWATLEDEVRKYVMKMNLDIDCYTGTWGTMHLKSPYSPVEERPFYLAVDRNNNGILPVPKLYYRIIIDRNNPKRGIAVVGVNDPNVTLREIMDNYMICNDIANDIPWLHWINNENLKKGYIYACAVAQIIQVLDFLPKSLGNVTEILA